MTPPSSYHGTLLGPSKRGHHFREAITYVAGVSGDAPLALRRRGLAACYSKLLLQVHDCTDYCCHTTYAVSYDKTNINKANNQVQE